MGTGTTLIHVDGHPAWRLPNGRVYPHVSGGSDTQTSPDPATPEPGLPDGVPAADEVVAGAEVAEADPAADWPEEARTLVGKLKDENVRYKERWRPIEERLSGLPDADRDSFLDFLADLRSGDPTRTGHAAGWMRQVLDHLSPAEQAEVAAAVEAGQDAAEEFDPFDRTNIEKLIEEKATTLLDQREAARHEERQLEDAKRQIESTARDLGYEDPESAAYAHLLFVAHRQHGDVADVTARLAKAHETIQNDLDRRAQEYLRRKQADANAPAAPADAVAPTGRTTPTTLDDAARSAAQRIDSILGGAVG